MFARIKQFLKKVKHNLSREHCYTDMEYSGYAAMGCCGGLVGGDISTEYLAYQCMDCPHYSIGSATDWLKKQVERNGK